jgi:hypothetical protein
MVRLPSSAAESGEYARKKLAQKCAFRAKREADILELWYNPDPRAQSEHIEYPEIMELLHQIEATARFIVKRIDATELSAHERKSFYDEVILRWHDRTRKPGYYFSYPLRTTSRSAKDYDFGVKRPIMVVYRNPKKYSNVVDVYPHQERTRMPDAELPMLAPSTWRLTVSVANFLRALTEL